MSDELVLREDGPGVATLTLNRPSKLNSLKISTFEVLDCHVRTLAAERDGLPCVMLRRAGHCFSVGLI